MDVLRPSRFDELIGQKKVISRLKIIIKSAQLRNDVLGHVLLSGPRGLGKTTIARAIANELNATIQIANGANLRSIKRLLPYIMDIKEGSILFIDEIHRMTALCQEYLYPVMEDYRVDVGNNKQKISLDLPKFTLIGATTDSGELEPPMIDRFTYKYNLKLYSNEDLSQLISVNASKIGLDISKKSCIMIAGISRNTPRIANAHLMWCRDYCTSKGLSTTDSVIQQSIDQLGVDNKGLGEQDRLYLNTLKRFAKPIGINTLADIIHINRETIEDIIEPYLLRQGLILRTPKGRIINGSAW